MSTLLRTWPLLLVVGLLLSCESPSAPSKNEPVPPMAPATLQATKSYDGLTLTWGAVPDASQYRVYSKMSSGGEYALLATVAAPTVTYVDATATLADKYYRVSAVAGGLEGAFSIEVVGSLSSLDAPANLKAVSSTAGVSLTWDPVNGAVRYSIGYSEVGAVVELAKTESTSYNDTSIGATTRTYVVSGITAAGNVGLSAAATGSRIAPSKVVGLQGVNQADGYVLSWSVVEGATSYEVSTSTTLYGTYATVGTSSTTTFTHVYPEVGTTLYYRVRAVTAALQGAYSDPINGWVLGKAVTPTVSDTGAKVQIAWSGLTGAPGTLQVQVQRSASPDSGYANLGSPVAATTGAAYDSTGTVGTTYYYRLVTTLGGVPSQPSAAKSVALSGTVQGLSASVGTQVNQISLGWNSLESLADSYVVESSTDGSAGSWSQLTSVTAASYTDTSFSNAKGVVRYYRVAGVKGGVKGTYSAVATGETFGRKPGTPTAQSIGSVSIPVIKITWTAIPAAKYYVVYIYDSLGPTNYTVGQTISGTTVNFNASTFPTPGPYRFSVVGMHTSAPSTPATATSSQISLESEVSTSSYGY